MNTIGIFICVELGFIIVLLALIWLTIGEIYKKSLGYTGLFLKTLEELRTDINKLIR